MQPQPSPQHSIYFPANSFWNLALQKIAWSDHALGLPEQWPQALRFSLGSMLHAGLPMFIWWDDAHYQFFNDAFLQNLHPAENNLGYPAEVFWAENWEALSAAALTVSSGSPSAQPTEISITRRGIRGEADTPVTIHLAPILNEAGHYAGIQGVCLPEQPATGRQDHSDQSILDESKARMLDAIPQQVWTATAQGDLIYVNEVIVENFGRLAGEVIGQGWQRFIHPDDLPLALRGWRHALQTAKPYMAEFRLRFRNGEYYWHLARAVPHLENGKVTLWIGTNTNIDLQKANERKRDDFVSIASHELKTPITSLKGFIQLSRRELNGVEGRLPLFLEKINRQTERLGKLIEDLLDVSKINAGKMVYQSQNFDLRSVLSEAIDNIQTTTHHHIELVMPASVEFCGDQSRIEQVMINLLGNAVKYSPDADRVVVNCSVQDENVIIAVQDFGIGIAAENIQKLFDRFYRIDNESGRYQGLGLGLFISAEIVKRHGGSFWIESTPGEGSTFSFLLPLNGEQSFKDLATDHQTFYYGNFISIDYRKDEHYLDVNWKGYQNYDSVVKGCTIMLDLMKKNNVSRVLNDNTHVMGNWSEASDWGSQIWFPDMAAAGLKKFAWIYSPSTFSRISSVKSVPPAYDDVELRFFDDRAEAYLWLQADA